MAGRPSKLKDVGVFGDMLIQAEKIESAKIGVADNQGRLPTLGKDNKNKTAYIFILKMD